MINEKSSLINIPSLKTSVYIISDPNGKLSNLLVLCCT